MVATPRPALTPRQVDGYIARLGIDRRGAPPDLDGLRSIHLAHLERIPFENLDIVFGTGVLHDQSAAVEKLIGTESGAFRGGWCFELNGALALLLEALGYDVRLLGAAVLLGGPTKVIDHLLLEVQSPLIASHLVDVGFGDSFDVPLELNISGPQQGGSGTFELIGSPEGTTLARHVDGVPAALLRFKRVAHAFEDFGAIAHSLQTDQTKKWSTHPFATRRLAAHERDAISKSEPAGVQRVTLSSNRLKLERDGAVVEERLERSEWDAELKSWFEMVRPGRWPTDA